MGLKGTGSGKRHIARGAIFKVDDTLGERGAMVTLDRFQWAGCQSGFGPLVANNTFSISGPAM